MKKSLSDPLAPDPGPPSPGGATNLEKGFRGQGVKDSSERLGI